jgi:hypothetical protein
MTLQGVGNTRIIAFPTSPKSHFYLFRRQKMNKKGQETTCNFCLSISRKTRLLDVQKVENEFRRIGDYFKNSFLDLNQIAFWAG